MRRGLRERLRRAGCVGVKRLDAKLPLPRVVLDLVEWFWFLFDVFDLFDGGEQVSRGLYIFIKNSSAAERR
jgi:hypothetical protein